jgi:hypothetical protein
MDVEHSVQTTNNAAARGVVDFAVQLRDPKQFNLKLGLTSYRMDEDTAKLRKSTWQLHGNFTRTLPRYMAPAAMINDTQRSC